MKSETRSKLSFPGAIITCQQGGPESMESMMYSCAPAARGSRAVVKKNSRSLRVDIHCHYLNPEAAARVAPLNPAQHEMQIKFANALTRETNKKQHARSEERRVGKECRSRRSP